MQQRIKKKIRVLQSNRSGTRNGLDGCRDPLVTWNGILIDGHNRYEICTRNKIDYKTVEMDFDSRADVKIWVIRNQFGRRNLTAFVRVELALQLESIFAKKAKENQAAAGGDKTAVTQKSEKAVISPISTMHEIAKLSGTSHDTVAKVKKITESATDEEVQAARRGDVSVNQAYNDIKQLEKKQRQKARECWLMYRTEKA